MFKIAHRNVKMPDWGPIEMSKSLISVSEISAASRASSCFTSCSVAAAGETCGSRDGSTALGKQPGSRFCSPVRRAMHEPHEAWDESGRYGHGRFRRPRQRTTHTHAPFLPFLGKSRIEMPPHAAVRCYACERGGYAATHARSKFDPCKAATYSYVEE